MFKLIWEFKELIAGVIVSLVVAWGVLFLWNAVEERAQLRETLKIERNKFAEERKAWGQEVIKWENQVTRQRQELEISKKKKAAAIQQERKKFEDIFKETNKINESVRNEIKANVRLRSGTISVPADFVRLYNSAVESSRVAAEGGEVRLPDNPVGTEGKSITYEASSFTDVIVENVLSCAALTLRHNKLVDTVNRLEGLNANTSRTNGESKEDRGDLPRRAIESIF